MLYTIETLIKKIPKYFDYFKQNTRVIGDIDFGNEGSNANQLRTILDSITNYIEDPQVILYLILEFIY